MDLPLQNSYWFQRDTPIPQSIVSFSSTLMRENMLLIKQVATITNVFLNIK